ncbi:MAG: hypothetical protein ACE5NM_09015, partial [Sedimentisphaerales bacterium]
MDGLRALSKSLGKSSLLIILASIFLLTTVLSEVVSSQTEEVTEQEAMRHLVGQMIQIGTTQYESGYYIQAEKTLLKTQAYLEYLTAAERNKLNELLDKTRLAALQRKQALAHKQTANELFRQGQLLKAKAHLERIKDSSFLTKQEQEQSLRLLKQIENQIFKASSSLARTEGQQEKGVPEPTRRITQGSRRAGSQPNDRKRRVAETYYRSMRLYHSGQLEKAREGFIEVVKSGLIPPAMVKTLQGYLTQIDNTLARDGVNPMPSGLTEINSETEEAEPNIAPPATPEFTELEVIEPGVPAPQVPEPEVAIPPEVSEPEAVAPAPAAGLPQEEVTAEPVTEQESYIEVIK